MMDLDPEGRVRGEGGEWGDGGNRDADNAEETNAARSIISFSSENKETKEPWPALLLYLEEMVLDRDTYQFEQTTKHKHGNTE